MLIILKLKQMLWIILNFLPRNSDLTSAIFTCILRQEHLLCFICDSGNSCSTKFCHLAGIGAKGVVSHQGKSQALCLPLIVREWKT
jgi:hypothetical protein